MNEPVGYELVLSEKATDQLDTLNKPERERIVKKLEWIAARVESLEHYMMTGDWAGSYRYKIGDYRVIYDLDHKEKIMLVIRIGHRKDVYD
ncbi:MAG: type II toxin-antitoxin system RelE/ParE family toxin [Anaerolineae bacterium]|nr:MAG: type II toxin-antitoxin system RelE/ParE family toxin [Anaerolineae bacterium]